jgi:hypothetical protein
MPVQKTLDGFPSRILLQKRDLKWEPSGYRRHEHDHRHWASSISRWTARTCIGLGVFFNSSAYAQELNDASLAFLKLHRVPCAAVIKVDTVVLDDVVTCEDGREWMLFWLENEVALVQPETRDLYKWDWELNKLYPQLYDAAKKQRHIVSAYTHKTPK